MDKKELVNFIDEFKSALISQATDGSIDEKMFKTYRETLLNIPELKGKVPLFIRNTRNPQEFFRYMQTVDKHYSGRRTYISDAMNELIAYVEETTDPLSIDNEYDNMKIIGSGGYGTVYKYHNNYLNKDFAVKVYDPSPLLADDNPEGEKRFYREASIMFSFDNPHIVKIYDAGKIADKPFIKMELIDGINLQEYHTRNGNLSFEKSLVAIQHILSGLQHAHSHGVIHRDLKPTNIMYSESERKLVIIDFGISAFLDSESHTKLTRTGSSPAGGTYTDPVLETNSKMRDVRSDIYSLGGIWYFLLCGRAPGGSDMPNVLKQSNPNLLSWQIDIVMKCMAGNIEDRYEDCKQLLAAIKNVSK